MSKPLTIRLSDDFDGWLREQAARSGQTRTAIVVAALTLLRFGNVHWQADD